MKIASSDIQMASSRSLLETREKSETLTAWTGKRPEMNLNPNSNRITAAANQGQGGITDRVTISNQQQPSELDRSADKTCSACDNGGSSGGTDNEVSMLKLLVENMIGRSINIHSYSSTSSESAQTVSNTPEQSADQAAVAQGAQQGWGIEYDSKESYSRIESTSFSAQGIIKTSDGREINFAVNLEMKQEFYQESSVSFRAGDAVQKLSLIHI